MITQGSKRYPVTRIVIHCTATSSQWRPKDTPAQRVEAIRQMHIKERGWRDIGYHWLIDRDGTVIAGRPENQIGSGVAGHNSGVLHVSLFGGKTSKHRDAFSTNYTPAQAAALGRVIDGILRRTSIREISGHNQYDNGKACPGFWVPDWLPATLKHLARK